MQLPTCFSVSGSCKPSSGDSGRARPPGAPMGWTARRSVPTIYWHRPCFQSRSMQATFLQKVILCAIAGFLAAGLIEWGKTFVEGADDALNKGYQHRNVIGPDKP